MKLEENNKGNGYVITGNSSKQKKKEKLILEAISLCLHEYPSKSINVITKDNEVLINSNKIDSFESTDMVNKHHK